MLSSKERVCGREGGNVRKEEGECGEGGHRRGEDLEDVVKEDRHEDLRNERGSRRSA